MRPESELEAEEVSFLNTCRQAFERLETVHARGRASVEMVVTTPARTVKFWCEGAAPEEPGVPGASGEWGSIPHPATDGITDTPFPPGGLILSGPGSAPPVPEGQHEDDFPNQAEREAMGASAPAEADHRDEALARWAAEPPPGPVPFVEVPAPGQWNMVQPFQPPPPPPAPAPPPPAPKSRKKP